MSYMCIITWEIRNPLSPDHLTQTKPVSQFTVNGTSVLESMADAYQKAGATLLTGYQVNSVTAPLFVCVLQMAELVCDMC
jgi:hypothetical protein